MPIELHTPKKKSARRKPDTNVISTVPYFNQYSSYPSHGLTPLRLTTILKEADQGDIYRQAELMEEILEKDPSIFAMFHSRRGGVIKVDHEVSPADDSSQEKEIAAFVQNVIENAVRWRETKEDILDAVPKGFSALWIEWQTVPDSQNRVVFKRLHHMHQKNFRFGKTSDPSRDLNEIRRLTQDNLIDGVELDPYKWLVTMIKARSGHPSRASLLRTCFWPYLFRNFGLKSFVQFCEIYGIPLRVGTYEAGAGPAEIEALRSALRGISTDAAALISALTKIEFPEVVTKSATGEMYNRLIELLRKDVSQAVLGHTGAAESTPGKLGGEDAALEAKWELVAADASAMDYSISDGLIRPLVEFNYGARQKYPFYKTKIEKPKDLKTMAEVDQVLVSIGVPLEEDYFYETYGRPKPKDGAVIVQPRIPQVTPFSEAVARGMLGKAGRLLR